MGMSKIHQQNKSAVSSALYIMDRPSAAHQEFVSVILANMATANATVKDDSLNGYGMRLTARLKSPFCGLVSIWYTAEAASIRIHKLAYTSLRDKKTELTEVEYRDFTLRGDDAASRHIHCILDNHRAASRKKEEEKRKRKFAPLAEYAGHTQSPAA